MFYKFKINYNESELSLTCLDKDMIEREMDLYFAFFADASDEFISKIKKIKKIPSKIQSIDEMMDGAVSEKLPLSNEKIEFALKTNILQEQLNETQKYLKENEPEPSDLPDENESISLDEKIAFPTVLEVENNENNIKDDVEIENKIEEQIFETKTDENEEIEEDITKKFGFDKLEPDFSPQYSEIQNMIKLAQNKIEAQDLKEQIINNDSSDELLKHFANDVEEIEEVSKDEQISEVEKIPEIEETEEIQDYKSENIAENIENETKNSNEEFLNDIFSNNLEENEIAQEIKNKTENIEPEPDAVINAKMNINEFLQMGSKFSNSNEEKFEIQQPSETELKEFVNNLDVALNDSIKAIDGNDETKYEKNQISLVENLDENEIKDENDIELDESENIDLGHFEVKEEDFAKFLSIFNPITLRDDFLLCAYFIKDILMQPSFTMKSINAKLYKATGSIAGISLLEELINENFIIQLENDIEEHKEYTISNLGERYIQENFQRQ